MALVFDGKEISLFVVSFWDTTLSSIISQYIVKRSCLLYSIYCRIYTKLTWGRKTNKIVFFCVP